MAVDGNWRIANMLFLCLFAGAYGATNPDDMKILNDFRKGLENSELLEWPENGDDPCGSRWPHVYCNGDRVTQIQVQGMGLKGPLPQNFNQLSKLYNLGLQKNHFNGKLPTFSGLSELKYAYLDNNDFDTIPFDFFDGLTSLSVMALDRSILCSIGSLGVHNSQACVSNITVRDTVIRESDNGLRIKTWQGGTGCVSGILFENINMENVMNCLLVDQYYCLSKACRNETSAVHVTDVTYRTIKGTYDVRRPPIHFACSDTVACTNIVLSEIELYPYEGELMDDPFCWNAYGTQETPTIPPIECLQDGEPEALAEASEYTC